MTQRWLRAVLIAVLVAGWSGCFFDADYARTRYQCEDGACPSGYTCRTGRCEPVSGGAMPGELEGCGTTDLLANDFAGPDLDLTHWYRWGGLEITPIDGRLQIVNPNPDNYEYGGYETQRLYLLRGSRVFVEVPDYDPATDGTVTLLLDTESVNDVAFELYGGEVVLSYALGGDRHTLTKLAHDPEAHRFWQVREEEGTLYWETSPDAETWEIQATTSSLPFDDLMQVKLLIGLPGGAGPVFFGKVNGGVAAQDQAWCAIDSFRDDFDDGLVGAAWSFWSNGACSFFERDGALAFSFPPAGDGDCGYDSITYYDLTGRTVSVEVPQVDESGKVYTVFRLDFQNDNWIAFEHGFSDEQPSRLVCWNHVAGAEASPCSLGYDASQHRWWRFRHDARENAVHWETSPDGKKWTSNGNYDAGDFQFTKALIVLYAESYGVADRTDAGNRFDNLNVGAD